MELALARFERTEGMPMVLRIEQPEIVRENIPLNAPPAEEPHVGPKLPATKCFHYWNLNGIPQTAD
jgi:hypothetical protein